jgi:hypothetical protein
LHSLQKEHVSYILYIAKQSHFLRRSRVLVGKYRRGEARRGGGRCIVRSQRNGVAGRSEKRSGREGRGVHRSSP